MKSKSIVAMAHINVLFITQHCKAQNKACPTNKSNNGKDVALDKAVEILGAKLNKLN